MRILIALTALAVLASGCDKPFMASSSVNALDVYLPPMSGKNVVPVTVSCGYFNEPCVSVTICNPKNSQCMTIDHILLDTGSYGLRVYNNLLAPLGLEPLKSGGETVAECQQYLDNSSDWGPIAMAQVQLGQEMTTQPIPIQLIDASFPSTQTMAGAAAKNSNCPNPDQGPSTSQFNGILGVGLFTADCGPGCEMAGNQTYWSCASNGTCTSVGIPQGAPGLNLPLTQVQNPVAYMATNNNGVILSLPALDSAGAGSAHGYLILGIDTDTNNSSTGKSVLFADASGNIVTKLAGHTYAASFIDSGSNGLYFPSAGTGLPTNGDGFYSPELLAGLTATLTDSLSNKKSETFNILSADYAFEPNNPNLAFNDVGAPAHTNFDWGLPFFFGKSVFVGIEGTTSNLGKGPYWAF